MIIAIFKIKPVNEGSIMLFCICICLLSVACTNRGKTEIFKIPEQQITFKPKTHSLDNNDNFSPDGKFLCYDTRGMFFDNNLGNCKSIEKVEIATGEETILWKPSFKGGTNAAPGVAAVSFHPTQNKVVFIHGPKLEEVAKRGYYGIRNRSGLMVDGDGKGESTWLDLRDITTHKPTIAGAHRGGTHRHEFSRNGNRIGFTYDDFLLPEYGRTIGYMEANKNAPHGYSHYFAVLVKPARRGESRPGEIEKAFGDSWVDANGTKRAFIGKLRSANEIDYEYSLFVAHIPDRVDITTAQSGDKDVYPRPPEGITIRRLTHSTSDDGIVRGSYNGKSIAYLSMDENGIKQVFVIPTDGDDLSDNLEKRPKQITYFKSDGSNIRWHPSGKWLFSISAGKVYASPIEKREEVILLTPDDLIRNNLVVSPSGDRLAYNVKVISPDSKLIIEGKVKNNFDQIFILELDNYFNK